ncbi:hypothetical protein MPER_08917, partial [Moniliophthora perniciosa FA553]
TLEVEIFGFVMIIAGLALSVVILIVIPVLLIDLVSVAVAFIPEGLPVCVTLSLTVIAHAMRKANIICKSLSTVESLGSVNFICSDKTGTLTQNKMTVVNILSGQRKLPVEKARIAAFTGEDDVRTIAAAACLCNDAMFEGGQDEAVEAESRKVNGDATDSGLLRFAESILSTSDMRASWREVGKLPFNSTNKFAVKLFKTDGGKLQLPLYETEEMSTEHVLLLVKGAPDVLMPRCTQQLNCDGTTRALSPEVISQITAVQEEFASQGQRVLLLARRVLTPGFITNDELADTARIEDKIKTSTMELSIMGLVALMDPLKEDCPETVRICRRAGIRFAMVT